MAWPEALLEHPLYSTIPHKELEKYIGRDAIVACGLEGGLMCAVEE